MKLRSISALVAITATLATMATAALFAISGSVAAAAQPAAVAHSSGTTVTTRHNSVGTFLVGPSGDTLYLWVADGHDKSNCTGGCADVWPPLMLHGTLKGTGGVKAKLLGSIARSGGGRQVTYNGHPLYYYESDTRPGQTTGEGSNSFNAKWYVVTAAGSAIKAG